VLTPRAGSGAGTSLASLAPLLTLLSVTTRFISLAMTLEVFVGIS
jgi:hypothetical protein